MNNPANTNVSQSFFSVAISRMVVVRAFKVALIVGTILAFINHSEKIFNASLSSQDWFKILLTYFVPYGVSTWSAVGAIRAQALNGT